MMKTIREFLEEQINEQLIQAVVSGRRTGEGPSKVKLRPVELKGQIFYQASMTEGTKVYHKNFTREEMIAYLEHAMEEFRQLQATGRSQDGSILISKKGKATIKTKQHGPAQNEKIKIAPHNRVKQYILREGTAAPFLVDLGVMTRMGRSLLPDMTSSDRSIAFWSLSGISFRSFLKTERSRSWILAAENTILLLLCIIISENWRVLM